MIKQELCYIRYLRSKSHAVGIALSSVSSKRASHSLGWHRFERLEDTAVTMHASEAVNVWQRALKASSKILNVNLDDFQWSCTCR